MVTSDEVGFCRLGEEIQNNTRQVNTLIGTSLLFDCIGCRGTYEHMKGFVFLWALQVVSKL